MRETIKKNYEKNMKHVGEVFALFIGKKFAIVQIAAVEMNNGFQVCRVFSKKYKEIPKNIEQIICEKEDYIVNTPNLHTVAHHRNKQGISLGFFSIPSFFEVPKFTRSCNTFRFKSGPFLYWEISKGYSEEEITFKEFITDVLKKDVSDDSWKKDFLLLNPANIYTNTGIIEGISKDFNLKKWKPTNMYINTISLLNKEKEELDKSDCNDFSWEKICKKVESSIENCD